MFKATRWRNEKNKIKVVFKLQFEVTQVPITGWESLYVALVPWDTGKPTVRSERAVVHDGTCRWKNAIYETVKLIKEPKSGRINEKIYQFLVSTGATKSGILGEVSVDLALFAETIKASSVSLPLNSSNSEAILHVTIERIQAPQSDKKIGENENGDVVAELAGKSMKSQLSDNDTEGRFNSNDNISCIIDKQKSSLPQTDAIFPFHETNLKTARSLDSISITYSDSSSGQGTPRGLHLHNNNNQIDGTKFLSFLRRSSLSPKQGVNSANLENSDHQRSNTEVSFNSIDDSTNSSEETMSRTRSDISSEKVKNDFKVLMRQIEVSELELQTLRKQIVRESRRGQDLSKEVSSLKEERHALLRECERLRSSCQNSDSKKGPDLTSILEEIKQELKHEKDLNADLRLQLQKTQKSNSELMLAVKDLDGPLVQKNQEIPIKEKDLIENQLILEMLDKKQNRTCSIQHEIADLYSEIEMTKREREELEMHMEQLALDYEILKQENHNLLVNLEQNHLQEQLKIQYEGPFIQSSSIAEFEARVESLGKELEKQRKAFEADVEITVQAKMLAEKRAVQAEETIRQLQTNVENLVKELENQAETFEADLFATMQDKVEQEKRAIQAEESLRKIRLNNVNTAERIQEEFKILYMQMSSTFEANERVAMEALAEASELQIQRRQLEDLLDRANKDLCAFRNQYEEKILHLQEQVEAKEKEKNRMLLELEDQNKMLENELELKKGKDRALFQEIQALKSEIDTLINEIYDIGKQRVENEKLRNTMEEMKASVKIALTQGDAERTLEEIKDKKGERDEKIELISLLQSEVAKLRSTNNEFRHKLSKEEIKKENLKKHVVLLKGDLKKKDDMVTVIEKKLQDTNGKIKVSDGRQNTTSKNNKFSDLQGGKEFDLQEKINLLEEEIKLKDVELQEITTTFLNKEKDMIQKIEDLEKFTVDTRQLKMDESGFKDEKLVLDEPKMKNASNLEDTCPIFANGINGEVIKGEIGNNLEKETKNFTKSQRNTAAVLSEIESLKQKNISMEEELKEMQERYSQISLKFAEVEGERQQLVMTIRNLRHSKK